MSSAEVFYEYLLFEEHLKMMEREKLNRIKFLRFRIIELEKLLFEKEMYRILKNSRKKNKKF
jgi:hypothetical protein